MARDPAVTLRTDPRTLVSVLFGGLSLDAAIAQGTLQCSGARSAAEALLAMFAAPVPADA